MHWQEQSVSEQIMHYLLLGCALVALLTGYFMSSYRMMFTMYLIGVFITFFSTVPEWSYFNRHPLEWWEPRYNDVPSSRQLRIRQRQQQQQLQQQQQQQQQAAKKSEKPVAAYPRN